MLLPKGLPFDKGWRKNEIIVVWINMNLVIFDDNKTAKILEQSVIGYYIKNKIESEKVVVFNEKAEITKFLNEAKNSNCIFFIALKDDESKLLGIEIARMVRKNNVHSHIVFIGDSEKHIKKCISSDIRPSYFFVKPIKNEELFSLLTEIYDNNLIDALKVKINGNVYFIKTSKIVYVEKKDKKTVFYSASNHIETYDTLTDIYNKCKDTMVYANKGQIVNKNEIIRVELNTNTIVLSGGIKIYVSRGMKKNFM